MQGSQKKPIFRPIQLFRCNVFAWHFHGGSQICSDEELWVGKWSQTKINRNLDQLDYQIFETMIKVIEISVQLPSANVNSWIDRFNKVVGPLVTKKYDCPVWVIYLLPELLGFFGLSQLWSKNETSHFSIVSSNESAQLSLEHFREENKSLYAVKC